MGDEQVGRSLFFKKNAAKAVIFDDHTVASPARALSAMITSQDGIRIGKRGMMQQFTITMDDAMQAALYHTVSAVRRSC